MTRFLLIASSAAALMAAPASAQLLGSSGSGSLGGGLGGTIGRTTGAATGTATGTARSTGDQSVDRRSGRVSTRRSVEGSGSGSAGGVVERGPRRAGGSVSGNGNGSFGTSADAQLVGTDMVRTTVSGATSEARGLAQSARANGESVLGGAAAAGSSASGSAMAGGNALVTSTYSGAMGQLVLAGSAASNVPGNFTLSPGMAIVDGRGREVGEVEQVLTNGRGRIEALLVDVRGSDDHALVAAGNFTGSGNLLLSSMSRGTMEEVAEDQAEAREEGDASSTAASAGSSSPAPSRDGSRNLERNDNVKDY